MKKLILLLLFAVTSVSAQTFDFNCVDTAAIVNAAKIDSLLLQGGMRAVAEFTMEDGGTELASSIPFSNSGKRTVSTRKQTSSVTGGGATGIRPGNGFYGGSGWVYSFEIQNNETGITRGVRSSMTNPQRITFLEDANDCGTTVRIGKEDLSIWIYGEGNDEGQLTVTEKALDGSITTYLYNVTGDDIDFYNNSLFGTEKDFYGDIDSPMSDHFVTTGTEFCTDVNIQEDIYDALSNYTISLSGKGRLPGGLLEWTHYIQPTIPHELEGDVIFGISQQPGQELWVRVVPLANSSLAFGSSVADIDTIKDRLDNLFPCDQLLSLDTGNNSAYVRYYGEDGVAVLNIAYDGSAVPANAVSYSVGHGDGSTGLSPRAPLDLEACEDLVICISRVEISTNTAYDDAVQAIYVYEDGERIGNSLRDGDIIPLNTDSYSLITGETLSTDPITHIAYDSAAECEGINICESRIVAPEGVIVTLYDDISYFTRDVIGEFVNGQLIPLSLFDNPITYSIEGRQGTRTWWDPARPGIFGNDQCSNLDIN